MITELAIIVTSALFVGGVTAFVLMKLEIDAGRRGRSAYARWLNARYVQKFNELGKRKFKASPKQLRAIEAMWAQVSRASTAQDRSKALNAFCKRLTGVEVITWICKDDAKIIIKAIQAMGAKSPEQFKQQTKNK